MANTTKGRRRITFTLADSGSETAALVGNFNQWDATKHPMVRNKEGVWVKTVMLAPGRHEYKFKVDEQWQCDPANRRRCKNAHGTQNSVIKVEPRG